MATPFPASRTLEIAAKRPQPSPADAPAASGYEHVRRPSLVRAYQRPESTTCVKEDR